MKAQTPNLRTTTSQTANHMTSEGKMNAPTGMPALSLQDVFPESASTTDSHQETIRPPAGEAGLFESEQEKGAQLQKGKGQKRPKSRSGGRRKLNTTEQRLINMQ